MTRKSEPHISEELAELEASEKEPVSPEAVPIASPSKALVIDADSENDTRYAALTVSEVTYETSEEYFPVALKEALVPHKTMRQGDNNTESFNSLQWQVATELRVHPAQITKEMVRNAIAREEMNIRRNCAVLGEVVATPSEIAATNEQCADIMRQVRARLSASFAP